MFPAETIRRGLAEGTMVITQNMEPIITPPPSAKVYTPKSIPVDFMKHANDVEEELEGFPHGCEAGADTIMDLSTAHGD